MTSPARITSVFLCNGNDIQDDKARGFDPLEQGKDSLFIVRRGNAYYAYRDLCPHWRVKHLGWKKDTYLNGDRNRIVCFTHGAQFDIHTGKCTIGPCLGQTLTKVPLSIDQDGNIFIADVSVLLPIE